MAGYAVECALKSCIAKTIRAEEYPPSDAREFYTHDFNKLLQLSGLVLPTDATFRRYWAIVLEWSEERRDRLYPNWEMERVEAEDIRAVLNDALESAETEANVAALNRILGHLDSEPLRVLGRR